MQSSEPVDQISLIKDSEEQLSREDEVIDPNEDTAARDELAAIAAEEAEKLRL